MPAYYAQRSTASTGDVTKSVTHGGLAHFDRRANQSGMFDSDVFLLKVLAKAGTQAAMARALNQPSSRIAELFREEGQKKRTLTMRDGMALAEAFNVPPVEPISAEMLAPILAVCLRYEPKSGWRDSDIERLAQEVVYGLGLLQSAQANPPSQDAIDLAARVIADRFHDKPA